MKKPSESSQHSLTNLIGLGNHSTRKSYYPELVTKLDELEKEKDRYKWLFENALHGIFQADAEGNIIAANPAMVALCGYADKNSFDQHVVSLSDSIFAAPEDYKRFETALLANGKVMGFETIFMCPQGAEIHVAMNVLLKQVDGSQPIMEAFVQDITETKQAQVALTQVNEQLEVRVQSRTQQLQQLNEKLWLEIAERQQAQDALKLAKDAAIAANKSKDKYLAAASHDLLQPLNAARLLIAALGERDLKSGDAHLVERVHLALENAEELLTDLLDISKLDQGAVQPDISDFRLTQLLRSLVNEFQTVAETKGLNLTLVDTSLAVKSDSRLLLRIVRNFISNAIRYTDTGRILVGARRLYHKNKLRIEVWDSGAGIPEDKQDEIFREFQQLECHTGQNRQGVGLGLAIVERIAKVLDLDLSVHSTEGKGSVFAVDVPLSDIQHFDSDLPTVAHPSADTLKELKILVIDNEENILASMEAILSLWGCDVVAVPSEEAALTFCDDELFIPDVILADYHLDHDLLGTQAIEKLRRHFDLDIPAAMLTADRSSECRRLFRQMGLQVLNKPVKPSKLRALLTHIA